MVEVSCMKKGITLIELIISLSIISIMTSIVFLSFSCYKDYKIHINKEYYSNVIIDFINNSREYCREKRVRGSIYIDFCENSFTFRVENKKIDEVNFPKDIDLTYAVFGNGNTKISINNEGEVTTAGTLEFVDGKGEKHKITISVVTSYVRIKE